MKDWMIIGESSYQSMDVFKMKLDTQGRIIGSFLIVTAYYVVLHVSATIGAVMYLTANAISMPFFIRTKGWDVVVMLSFLMAISLTKLF